ncbi:MAG: hypothetical protein U0Z75_05965 [Deinococcaceae bacterium]
MRRYIVIGLLLMLGKGMAATGIPTDVEVCSAGVLTQGDQGNAGVLIKEGKYCERELNEDASKVVIFTLDGGSDPSCEDTGECTDVIIEPKDPPTGGSGGSGGTSGSDWLNKMLIPKRGTPYRNRALGFDCVSSTSFSPVFSSLSGCSGSPAGRDDQPKSPKPEPEPKRYSIEKLSALIDNNKNIDQWKKSPLGESGYFTLFSLPNVNNFQLELLVVSNPNGDFVASISVDQYDKTGYNIEEDGTIKRSSERSGSIELCDAYQNANGALVVTRGSNPLARKFNFLILEKLISDAISRVKKDSKK